MIAAIIQARTGSTRLPNKVFKDICGYPLIWHVVNRLKISKKIEKIILATTNKKEDDVLEEWAVSNNIGCYRGSENDVLDRFYQAARIFKADIVVRITADDPFKDASVIDNVVRLFEDENLDFAYNNKPPTFPEGLDVEVFSFESLEKAWFDAKDDFSREHVTPYLFNNPFLFKQKCLSYKSDISYLRWTIDTKKDLDMVRIIYDSLFNDKKIFSMDNILDFLEKRPDVSLINSGVERSAMYKNK